MSVWTLGDGIFSFWVQYLNPEPDVTIADAFYLAFYPFMYVGLVLLLRQHISRFHGSATFDGLPIVLGIGAFGSLTIEAAHQANDGLFDQAVNIAYPVGDMLLLIVSVGLLALLGRRAGWAGLNLVVGCALFTAADTIFLFEGNSYQPGTLLDAGWPAAMTLFALAGWQADHAGRVRFEGTGLLAVPVVVSVSSIAYLVASARTKLPFAGILLAAGALLAVVVRTILSFREVSQLAETRRQANTDDLTGLANRRRLYRQLDRLESDPACERFAILLIDLDNFKEVNDALGHSVGDELLCEFAALVAADLGDVDLAARLGGDEFALVLPDSDQRTAVAAADKILEHLRRPFVLSDLPLHVDASVGVALYPQHGTSHAELLRHADVAMYRAKRTRAGCVVYSTHWDIDHRGRLVIIEELRAAIVAHQLTCFYQPMIDLATSAVIAAEALVRWRHPTRGLLGPAEFLPLAEDIGLMPDILREVLDQALSECTRWRGDGHDMRVAVNLSATNLLDGSLVGTVRDALRRHGLAPGALQLEITEDVLVADPIGAHDILGELRALGVTLSLDDYGTGYNSMACLQTLPLHELKLDNSFVTGIEGSTTGRAIVKATVTLARSLGLSLVAEGIESEADRAQLAELGVRIGQGYWICRPQPPADFTRWLDAGRVPMSAPAVALDPAPTA
jgi:diguanylate cyclase (GGDEF)-like protein